MSHAGKEKQKDKMDARSSMESAGVIVSDPEILGGVPVFRGTRVPFDALLDYLEGGRTILEFVDDFPTVSMDSVIAGLEMARSLLTGNVG